MSAAPLFAVEADGPEDGAAAWAQAQDGCRIRLAAWGRGAAKGTVFLFPGRTEYVEKYGRAARDLLARGYTTLTIDWRGQGLAQRALADPIPGHVGDFAEYQRDVGAMLAFARAQGLPEPYFLLAHSMGGCIGLRTVMGSHPFRAAAFSAPMWGILMPAWQRPGARALAALAPRLGLGHLYVPGTGHRPYVLAEPFEGNKLTTDPEMWAYMQDHLHAAPGLCLGGPTLAWLGAALAECAALAALASPALPCLTALGSDERIVDARPIHDRMGRWPGASLDLVPGAQHELMMERGREAFFDRVAGLFDAHRPAG